MTQPLDHTHIPNILAKIKGNQHVDEVEYALIEEVMKLHLNFLRMMKGLFELGLETKWDMTITEKVSKEDFQKFDPQRYAEMQASIQEGETMEFNMEYRGSSVNSPQEAARSAHQSMALHKAIKSGEIFKNDKT